MIPLEIYWSISDIIGLSVFGLFVLGAILYGLIKVFLSLWDRIFKWKAYTSVFTDAPQMLLDRKWGVKYKKHFWNNWKIYKEEGRKYSTDYLASEADRIAAKIRKGEIKV